MKPKTCVGVGLIALGVVGILGLCAWVFWPIAVIYTCMGLVVTGVALTCPDDDE